MKISDIYEHILSTIGSTFSVHIDKYNNVVITTPFTYPDGDLIQVHVYVKDDDIVVTDFSETCSWLITNGFDEHECSEIVRKIQDEFYYDCNELKLFPSIVVKISSLDKLLDTVYFVVQYIIVLVNLCRYLLR